MPPKQVNESTIQTSVRNIGGISETSVEFSPGVTVIAGRNATNRTSFLRAVMAVMGSDDVALKGDASEGSVDLTVEGETYSRSLSRLNRQITFDGDPFLDDPELAELFAFLLESNEARKAVERREELYEVIMQPVDTEEIDTQIDHLERERDELEDELEKIESLAQRLPELEEQRSQLESDIKAKRGGLQAKIDEFEELDGEAEAASALEEQFDELRETRNKLEDIRNDIDDEERIIEALQGEKAELEASLDELPVADEDRINELGTEVSCKREKIESIESTLSEFQSVIKFNQTLIGETNPELLEGLRKTEEADTDTSVTDQLVQEGTGVVCWTCGSSVDSEQIEQTIDLLRELHREKINQRNALRDEIEQLESERKQIEQTKRDREQLRKGLDDVESNLEMRGEKIDRLEEEAGELETTVSHLETTIDEQETADHDQHLAIQREVNELEFELDRLESELEDISDEIESIEIRVDERAQIEDRRAEIDEELESLRSRIERLEEDATEQFNDHMATLLDILEFANLERIWIERIETEVRDGRRKVTKNSFDLHVIRTTESGSVYEDTVSHLSESEREVVGLVFALSGYLVHEVYEQVPFMLLDSLEALDSERIAKLIDFFAQHAENLVVALLPEDASAVDENYQRITDI